jgi:hypothetical protein
MAGAEGAWPRSLLDQVVHQHGSRTPSCEEFAFTLRHVLAEQRNGLSSHLAGTCLLVNNYDCHSLVELYRPSEHKWMILDPTFAVSARHASGQWASMEEVSAAVRRKEWAAIRFVPLDEDSIHRLRSYYIDYPLYFVSPLRPDMPRAESEGSLLRYYEPVALPVRQPGSYAIHCLRESAADAIVDGRPASLVCRGRDRLSEIFVASSIEGAAGRYYTRLPASTLRVLAGPIGAPSPL